MARREVVLVVFWFIVWRLIPRVRFAAPRLAPYLWFLYYSIVIILVNYTW
jgi:hypothetical protein